MCCNIIFAFRLLFMPRNKFTIEVMLVCTLFYYDFLLPGGER